MNILQKKTFQNNFLSMTLSSFIIIIIFFIYQSLTENYTQGNEGEIYVLYEHVHFQKTSPGGFFSQLKCLKVNIL